MSKSKSEKVSPLVQALDASNPPSVPSYLPTNLATAFNFGYPAPLQGGVAASRGHTHLAAAATAAASSQGGKGLYSNSSSASSQMPSDLSQSGVSNPSNLPSQFLGQSQPGFPSSCFRVKGHVDGGGASSSAAVGGGSPAVATTTSRDALSDAVTTVTSYSSCLGPDWPDLGITLGQSSKNPSNKSPFAPDLGTAVGQGAGPQSSSVPFGQGLGAAVGSSGAQSKVAVVAPPGAEVGVTTGGKTEGPVATVAVTTPADTDTTNGGSWKMANAGGISSAGWCGERERERERERAGM